MPPDACAAFDGELQARFWKLETGIINVLPASDVAARLVAQPPAEVDRSEDAGR